MKKLACGFVTRKIIYIKQTIQGRSSTKSRARGKRCLEYPRKKLALTCTISVLKCVICKTRGVGEKIMALNINKMDCVHHNHDKLQK